MKNEPRLRLAFAVALVGLGLLLSAARCDRNPDVGEGCSNPGEVVTNEQGEQLICVEND